jgi:hypothetical protein
VKESVYQILEGTDASAAGELDTKVFPMMRRPSPVGEATDEEIKPVDASDAVDREGGKNHSITVNGVNESINEFNWKAAALGGMMAMSPMQANAQSQYNQSQQNTRIEQQAPMSVENAKKILQKWNSMSPLPTITKQEAQNKIFNTISMSEYGKIDASTKLLDSILIKSNDGKFLTGKSFSLNDIQAMYNKYGDRIAIMQIDGTKYFVNIDALADWDF